MIENKKLNIITAAAMAVIILLTALLLAFPDGETKTALTASSEPLYAEKIFGTDVIIVDIIADKNDWQEMLDNAMNEEYISADVVINGTKFSNVGIRPKGNSSLQQVVSSDSDRYSFKIKFDEYVDGQTCFGLDMLVLNNMLGDATYMKEYITFDMMHEMGIDTPYYSYSSITVNGEAWGFYFALEAYNDSYEQRVTGDESGKLYSVKNSMGKGGEGENNKTDFPVGRNGNAANPQENTNNTADETSERTFGKSERGNGGMGGAGASSSGGSLVYTDDNSSSYSAIFENAIGSDSTEEDYQKVITALKALNSGENIEEYFDVDEILRYLAVHTVTVNLDSYSSNMAQNYFIFEYDGVIKILPWDYNYAWGAFQSGSASNTVNFPIDTPVSGVEMSERPLISKLFENDEYLERYHSYLKELMDSYFSDGKFAEKIEEINSVIGSYVQSDASAFYTYDEYIKALSAFKNIGELRMESIYGQLDGTVPSTTAEQTSDPDKLIDSSSVNLSDLGTAMGGGEKNFGGNMGGFGNFGNRNNSGSENDIPSMNGGMPQQGEMPQMPDTGNMPVKPNEGNAVNGEASDFPQGEMPQMPDTGNMPINPNEENSENSGTPEIRQDNTQNGFPENGFKTDKSADPPDEKNTENSSGLAVTAVSFGVLAAAIVCVLFVKRKF
ncbi:MAG: CotH kinase family protein [Oscillospiraceae bacterium]